MHDSLYLGFDGGATQTTGIAIDDDRNVLAEQTGGATNFQIIGTEKASQNILVITEAMLGKAGAGFTDIKVIYLGLTGAGRIGDADRMRNHFVKYLVKKGKPVPNVQIGSDAIAALEGAFSGKPGMILISGTGSILFAKDENERLHRVGGWGRYIGDEGSGYAIGRACLSAIAQEFDGRGKKTSLSRLLKEFKGIETSESLIEEVYRNGLDIASLAPMVIEAAADGDSVAEEILTSAAAELSEHLRAMLPQLKSPLPVSFAGSMLCTNNFFSEKVRRLIQDKFPELKIQEPEHPPAVGAALLALKIERSQ